MTDGIITPCNVAGDCGITCHGIRPNVRHIEILHIDFQNGGSQPSCKSLVISCLAVSMEYRRVTNRQTDILRQHRPLYA